MESNHDSKRNLQIASGIWKCMRILPIVSGIRKKVWNPPTFAESAYICGTRNNCLYSVVAESATKLLCRQNLRTGICMLKPRIFPSETHSHVVICLKTCLWNLAIHRHQILRLSSAQFGLMLNRIFSYSKKACQISIFIIEMFVLPAV